jgi:hypothetical protein
MSFKLIAIFYSFNRHAELVSASHLYGLHQASGPASEIPKQVRDDF